MFITVKGDLPEDCYTPYQIQKILNARLSQVSCDMMTGDYKVFETGEQISQKKAFEITNGVTKTEKYANMAFVLDTTTGELKQEIGTNLLQSIFDQYSIQEKVMVTNELLKNLGVNFSVQLATQDQMDEMEQGDDDSNIDEKPDIDTNDIDAGEDEDELNEDYGNEEPFEYIE